MMKIDLSTSEEIENSVLTNCANPYDVNPVMVTSQQAIPNEVKLEMEEFRDLAPYLPMAGTSNSMDELNTPTFDKKGPFDFMTTKNIVSTTEDPFKFEYNNIFKATGNSVLYANKQPNDFSVVHQEFNSEIGNMIKQQQQQQQDSPTESINFETPFVQNEDQQIYNSAMLLKIEDHSVKSDSNVSSPHDGYYINSIGPSSTTTQDQYSNISSPCDENTTCNEYYIQTTKLGIDTPDDSNCSSVASLKNLPKLKTNFGNNPFINNNIPNTPDVIDAVVSLDETFNILDFINGKDISTVNREELYSEIPFAIKTPSPSTSITYPSSNKKIIRKHKRISRHNKNNNDDNEDDSNDEDYVPPTKKFKATSEFDDDNDEDDLYVDLDGDEEYVKKKKTTANKKKRSRRRRQSFSSESSDVSKYRELRDKNNEASRRSRLKRKIKEKSLEDEADVLNEKNLKLKAQVTELERMVNTFRNNLFKIMLKK